METRNFAASVYALVKQIPPGRVLSYGRIAALCGRPRGARLAGRALRYAPPDTPCHRVVNSAGRTAPGWDGQRGLLEAEGVRFKPNGCVDMRGHLWQ